MSDAQRRDEIQGEILHEYDGIEEADNNLPNWWLATFYGAILFSIGYWFYYHEFNVEPTQSEAYAVEAASIQTAEAATEPELLALLDDSSAIASGRPASMYPLPARIVCSINPATCARSRRPSRIRCSSGIRPGRPFSCPRTWRGARSTESTKRIFVWSSSAKSRRSRSS